MTNPVIGTKGAALDLLVRQGATVGPHTVTYQEDGVAVDITGATVSAKIRLLPSSVSAAATATCALVTPASGIFTFTFSATDTAALTCSDVDENEATSLYYWDLEILFSGGRVVPLLYGDVRVFREITK